MEPDDVCKDCVDGVISQLGLIGALNGPAPFWVQGYIEYLCYFRFSPDQIVRAVEAALRWNDVFQEIKTNYPDVRADDVAEVKKKFLKGKISKAQALDMAQEVLKPKKTPAP